MCKLSRLIGFFAALFFLSCLTGRAQDIRARVEAIRLLQHANAVSSPSHLLSNHRQLVRFRAYGLDGTTKDGTYESISGGGVTRDEIVLGKYDAITIHFPDRRVQNDYQPPPPEMLEMNHLVPVVTGRFDQSDVINAIEPDTLFGRPAKCIEFDTVNGRTRQSNEICVDDEQGTLVRWRVGNERVENTDFFSFEGMLLPGRIRHYINGELRMEVEQQYSVIEEPIDWAALTPANPHIFHKCQQFSRPTIQVAPQPAGAGAGPWYDVKIQGVIGADGRVHEAAVLAAGRPDLEKQAVELVGSWRFSPPLCDGRPTAMNADLVVHFPPQ